MIGFSKEDFEIGERMMASELIDSYDDPSLYRAGLWVIISSRENYEKQYRVYLTVLNRGFDNAQDVLDDEEGLKQAVQNAVYPNIKAERVYRFSKILIEGNLGERIRRDIENNRRDGFGLRNELGKSVPGMGLKVASLFMLKLGYKDLVPVDVWMLRYLQEEGINADDGRTPSWSEYFEYEKMIANWAIEFYGVSPAMLQCIWWAKASGWGQRRSQSLFEFVGDLPEGFRYYDALERARELGIDVSLVERVLQNGRGSAIEGEQMTLGDLWRQLTPEERQMRLPFLKRCNSSNRYIQQSLFE